MTVSAVDAGRAGAVRDRDLWHVRALVRRAERERVAGVAHCPVRQSADRHRAARGPAGNRRRALDILTESRRAGRGAAEVHDRDRRDVRVRGGTAERQREAAVPGACRRHGSGEARDRVDRGRDVRVVEREAAVSEHCGVVASDLNLERVAGSRRVESGQCDLLLLVPALERSSNARRSVVLAAGDRHGVRALVVQRVGVAVRVVARQRHGLYLARTLERELNRLGRVVRAVHDRRRECPVVIQAERVEGAAVVRLLDRGEAGAAAEVDQLDVRDI